MKSSHSAPNGRHWLPAALALLTVAALGVEFVAQVARDAGLQDYRVIANVGPGAGQTILHLHWHVLGGRMPAFG